MSNFNIIQHATLSSDSKLHNPKGFLNAQNGTYLCKNQNGVLEWKKGNQSLFETKITPYPASQDTPFTFEILDLIKTEKSLVLNEFCSFRVNLQCVLYKNDNSFISTFQFDIGGFYYYTAINDINTIILSENPSIEYIGDNTLYDDIDDILLVKDDGTTKITFSFKIKEYGFVQPPFFTTDFSLKSNMTINTIRNY